VARLQGVDGLGRVGPVKTLESPWSPLAIRPCSFLLLRFLPNSTQRLNFREMDSFHSSSFPFDFRGRNRGDAGGGGGAGGGGAGGGTKTSLGQKSVTIVWSRTANRRVFHGVSEGPWVSNFGEVSLGLATAYLFYALQATNQLAAPQGEVSTMAKKKRCNLTICLDQSSSSLNMKNEVISRIYKKKRRDQANLQVSMINNKGIWWFYRDGGSLDLNESKLRSSQKTHHF
jgi:hypothetical protein